jgi:hypothetical protein
MSKVGRASRNASYKRVETITASKTIADAESGEVYFIGDIGSSIDITLPALKAGAYFKFIISEDMDNNSTVIDILTAGAAGTIQGLVHVGELDGTGPPTFILDGGSATKLTIDGNPDVNKGSYLEIECDGTNWWVTGRVITDSGGTHTNVFAWDA